MKKVEPPIKTLAVKGKRAKKAILLFMSKELFNANKNLLALSTA